MNRSYVVFGAYGGIGAALCRRLIQKGAHVLLAGRDEVGLGRLAAEPPLKHSASMPPTYGWWNHA